MRSTSEVLLVSLYPVTGPSKVTVALASGDTEAACRAVYAHYMEPMERMRSANSAVQAADETAK